jgi:ubiquinone/menaquinone biosynthesis C-methylase UbiE
MDEFLPAIIRDSYLFMYPFFFILYRGKNIKRRMHFKTLAYSMSEKELNNFYSEADLISRNRDTDLSESNIKYIIKSIPSDVRTLVDVGCGKGFLLSRIHQIRPEISLHGVDLENHLRHDNIHFTKGSITCLPFPNNHFDLVICTHTIEHIVLLSEAIKELIRITGKRLIVVTPCQRYFYFTFDGHVNFFYKSAELLRHFSLDSFQCKKLDMDWIYLGDKITTASGK